MREPLHLQQTRLPGHRYWRYGKSFLVPATLRDPPPSEGCQNLSRSPSLGISPEDEGGGGGSGWVGVRGVRGAVIGDGGGSVGVDVGVVRGGGSGEGGDGDGGGGGGEVKVEGWEQRGRGGGWGALHRQVRDGALRTALRLEACYSSKQRGSALVGANYPSPSPSRPPSPPSPPSLLPLCYLQPIPTSPKQAHSGLKAYLKRDTLASPSPPPPHHHHQAISDQIQIKHKVFF